MGCRVKGMSTQEYRASYDYRKEYFKQNPGLFGCIWFCSQCYRPLFGKKNVVIDHIRPLNKGGRNHVSNCTACCYACNSAKSDIVDGRMYKGYVFKAFESTFSRANRGVAGAAALGVGLTAGAASAVVRTGAKGAKAAGRAGTRAAGGLVGGTLHLCGKVVAGSLKAVTFPIRKGSFISRLMFLGIYTIGILYLLSRYTTVLDTWIA